MKIFLVGGALRDYLLHRPVSDQDWVVVGANPDQMLALGFLPVGKDFPVFLHPRTHQEYALARTERKTGKGYKGFAVYSSPDVSLEQDLARRDLTINAMALSDEYLHLLNENCATTDKPTVASESLNAAFNTTSKNQLKSLAVLKDFIVDPFNGIADLHHQVLRHVGPAFAEDPVRILRLARFAARYTDFVVAPETMHLMQEMVHNGEVNALVAERVWQELAKGLIQAKPSLMMKVLHDCGALKVLLAPWEQLWQHPCELDLAFHLIDGCGQQLQILHQGLLSQEPSDNSSLLANNWRSHSISHTEQSLINTNTIAQLIQWVVKNNPSSDAHQDANHYDLSIYFCCFCLACLYPNMQLAVSKDTIKPFSLTQLNEIKSISVSLKVPVDCRDLTHFTCRELPHILAIRFLDSHDILELLERLDAFRKPQRFINVLLCADQFFQQLLFNNPLLSADWGLTRLAQAFVICQNVDTFKVAEEAQINGLKGLEIGLEIKKVRQKSLFLNLFEKSNLA